jgi:hypothetical protein
LAAAAPFWAGDAFGANEWVFAPLSASCFMIPLSSGDAPFCGSELAIVDGEGGVERVRRGMRADGGHLGREAPVGVTIYYVINPPSPDPSLVYVGGD